MSPEEVGGLKQVGDSLGIKMSTNPYTGMPEAFSFGDFFTSFLPTIVGAAVGGPAGGGLMSSMTPILAGAGTGALLAAAKGDDPLMGGLTGGLGGYGGSQLGQSFSGAFGGSGGTTAGSMGDLVKQGVTNLNPAVGQSGIVGATGQLGPDMGFGVAGKQAADLTTQTLPNFAAGPNFTPTAPLSPTASMAQNVGDLGTGVKNLTGFGDMSIGDAYGKFTQAGGTASQLAMPVGGAVLAGLEPSDLGYGTGNLYEDPEKGKYRGPQGQLNLSDKYSSGLRLVAKGGYIDGYATGGTIQSGGIRDLYGSSDNQAQAPISTDGYGLGRLSNLANEQAMTQAQTTGYAEGGDVSNYRQDQAALNMNELPTLNVNTGTQGYGDSGRPEEIQNMIRAFGMAGESPNINPGTRVFSRMMSEALRGDPGILGMFQGKGAPSSLILGMAKGGYLDGQGDGMSDSIPATIEGKQPARLADGEFVVPADVVSHLGNGSSKAGSKRLYAMLDKVRHARTGNKKQGKEINPAKYMPA
jgi:hypothetical protein